MILLAHGELLSLRGFKDFRRQLRGSGFSRSTGRIVLTPKKQVQWIKLALLIDKFDTCPITSTATRLRAGNST
jgi:hypothetical protein